MSLSQYVTVKKPSARKLLRHFLEWFYVKPKTDVRRFFASKSKHKAIIAGIIFWSIIPKMQGHSKIYQQVKKALYNCILQHTRVLHSPIENYCLKLSIDGQLETQIVPIFLLNVSVRELHKISW